MNKLLNRSLKQFMIYAGIVLACSIPVYYLAISMLWQYEINEHNIHLTPEAERQDSVLIIGAVTILTVLFFTLLLGGFIWLNRRISRKLWQPFYQSLSQIRNFELDQDRVISFGQTEIAEFAELNESLDKLIAGNVTVYKQQKEFADNASHELQTPLSIVQSKLELLLQSSSLTDDQYNMIEESLQALARVGRINKNLLLLTKIENSQFMEKEKIDLSILLENTLLQLLIFAESRQLTLQTKIEPTIAMEGNKILVEILLNNLLINAIRHSPFNSTVSISLSTNELVVKNPGSVTLKGQQLFRRFAQVSSQTPGTGLGLALVKQICNRYNWQIDYTFSEGLHIFSLHFNSDFIPNLNLSMQQ